MRGYRIVKRHMTRWEAFCSARPRSRIRNPFYFVERETYFGGWRKLCIESRLIENKTGIYTGGYSMYAYSYETQRDAERALATFCMMKEMGPPVRTSEVVAEFEGAR